MRDCGANGKWDMMSNVVCATWMMKSMVWCYLQSQQPRISPLDRKSWNMRSLISLTDPGASTVLEERPNQVLTNMNLAELMVFWFLALTTVSLAKRMKTWSSKVRSQS